VIVINNLIDITLIVRTGKDDNLAFAPHDFVEFLEFVEKYKPIDDRHVNVKENEAWQIIGGVLVFPQIIKRSLTRTFYLHSLGELGDLNDPFTDKIISIVIIYEHYQINCFDFSLH
jgi:hypothetical protein